MDGSTNNNGNDSSGNPKQDSKHGDSFQKLQQDNKNYIEEYGEHQEKMKKESRNLENLKDQRERLDEMDPRQASRAHKLDEQILESEKKIAGHQHNMDVADTGIKATKHEAMKDPEYVESLKKSEGKNLQELQEKRAGLDADSPEAKALDEKIEKSKAKINDHDSALKEIKKTSSSSPNGRSSGLKNAGKGFLATAALSATSVISEEFGVDESSNSTLFAFNNVAKAADGIFGGVLDTGEGLIRGGVRMLRGDFSGAGSAVSDGISAAASSVITGLGHLQNADERFTQMQSQKTINAMQNDQGLAPAIDAYNTHQNITSMQRVQPNTITTMQTRSGEPNIRCSIMQLKVLIVAL